MYCLLSIRCIILRQQDVSCYNDKMYYLSFSYITGGKVQGVRTTMEGVLLYKGIS